VVSGCLKRSESVEVLPIQKTSRLRGLQVHNLPVEEVFTGQRVAFNLADLSKSELDKGFELSRPGFYEPTQRVYVEISLLPALTRSLASGARIRLHKGTCEVMARVKILDQEQIQPGGRGLAMLRLESPVSAIRNERCLLRMYSPMILIGSGTILESHPEHYRRERREALEYLNALRIPGGTCVEQIIRYRITPVRSEGETAKAANLTETAAGAELERLLGAGTVLRMKDGSFIHRAAYDAGRETLTNLLKTLHERSPMLRYIPAAALFKSGKSIPPILLEKIVGDLAGEGTIERRNQDLRLAAHTVSLSADFKALLDRVEQWAVLGGYKTFELGKITSAFPDQAPDTIQNTVVYLTDTGRLAEIQSGEYLSSSALRRAEQALREYLREKPGIRASEFKDIINISRETARSILDYFLKTGITVRNQGTHTLADRDPDKTNG
jgi:selenocysteine-specific elongation factor